MYFIFDYIIIVFLCIFIYCIRGQKKKFIFYWRKMNIILKDRIIKKLYIYNEKDEKDEKEQKKIFLHLIVKFNSLFYFFFSFFLQRSNSFYLFGYIRIVQYILGRQSLKVSCDIDPRYSSIERRRQQSKPWSQLFIVTHN